MAPVAVSFRRGVGYSMTDARSLMLDVQLWPKPSV
jgi:hypothetical protein